MSPDVYAVGKRLTRRSSRSQQFHGSRELPSLTDEQQQFLDDYRFGRVETFQAQLADDSVLSEYVRMECNA